MELAHITLLAFAFFSSLRVVSYVPQILKVAADSNGASAISYTTWSMWTAANIATALYGAVNLQDLYLSLVSAIYAACCITVIVMTRTKRRRLEKLRRMHLRAPRPMDIERTKILSELHEIVASAAASFASRSGSTHLFERRLSSVSWRLVRYDLIKGPMKRLRRELLAWRQPAVIPAMDHAACYDYGLVSHEQLTRDDLR